MTESDTALWHTANVTVVDSVCLFQYSDHANVDALPEGTVNGQNGNRHDDALVDLSDLSP